MHRTKMIIGFLFTAAAVFLLACGSGVNITNSSKPANSPPPSPAATTDELAADRALYTQNCAQCHKETGAGGKVTVDGKELNPKDLTSERMKNRSDQKLFEDISEGAPDDGMPGFKAKLSDAEIKRTVHYIRVELQKTSASQTN